MAPPSKKRKTNTSSTARKTPSSSTGKYAGVAKRMTPGKPKPTRIHKTRGSSKSSTYIPSRVRDERALQDQEKRLKQFRDHAPKTFLEKLLRAQTQRMIVIKRTRYPQASSTTAASLLSTSLGRRSKTETTKRTSEYDAGEPREEIDIVGSTGNIYRVTINKLPSCTCPDHLKGNECKHKVYALHTVLKAPEHLQYQRAFLTSELEEIFENAPPIPSDVDIADDGNDVEEGNDDVNEEANNAAESSAECQSAGRNGSVKKKVRRKSTVGECPICYMDLEPEHNDLVWCRAACGNNMHKECFEQWAKASASNSNSSSGAIVRCVYCRTPWVMDPMKAKDLDKILQNAELVTVEGYVNIAEHFGISRARDYSTYHQPWVRRTFGV